MDGGDWVLRYRTREGKDVKRKLVGLAKREVEAVATHINGELLRDSNFIPGAAPIGPTVNQAIADAIALRNTRPGTTLERIRRAKKFETWLAANHPGVKHWEHLRPAMVKGFAHAMERDGKAFDTVRLCLEVIRLTWKHVLENHPELNMRPLPTIKLKRGIRREIDCLSGIEVRALLDWSRARDGMSDVHAVLCLAGLAGLRLQEAIYLRAQDVDLETGWIEITANDMHVPKTRDSHRRIPVCAEIVEALRSHIEAQTVKSAEGWLFLNAKHRPWGYDGYSHRLTVAKRAAAEKTGLPRLAIIPARRLRASFATLARELGIERDLVKRYVGHAPGDILAGHYEKIDVAELRAVSGRMDRWRDGIPEGQIGTILETRAAASL
jgi:integrase